MPRLPPGVTSLLILAMVAVACSAVSFASMRDSGLVGRFLVLPGIFNLLIAFSMLGAASLTMRDAIREGQVARNIDRARDREDTFLLASRTHPEDPANASECAICLDRMDGITLCTTVHPDTGDIHLDVERVHVIKCTRCKCALHVECLRKMVVAGGRRCPCCNLQLKHTTLMN